MLFLWGSSGSARLPIIAPQSWLQRPQTLMNNPTHRLLKKKFAQEQRRQRKFARRGLGRYLRACGLSNRAGCPHRASGWTLAQCTCRSSTCIAKTSYKTAEAFPWPARAAPFCAKMPAPATHLRLATSPWLPFCAFPSHASQFAVCLRALCGQRDPTGLLRDAAAGRARGGAGTTLRYCCRYGCQVRLSGTALRYGSQVLLRAASAPVILAHPHPFSRPYPRTFRAHTDDIQCLFPRPPTHLPRTF